MKAMVLTRLCNLDETVEPLELIEMQDPEPGEREIIVKVSACGVCHTELDEIEGRTPPTDFPIVLGHQVVGNVERTGSKADIFAIGDRVGIAWIYFSCGECKYCLEGNENLCNHFKATGRDVNGGYAQYMAVPEDFVYKIPETYSDLEAAPLLCAGAIGYRSLKLSGLKDGGSLGLVGFGASAHIVLKLMINQYPNSKVFVFARSKKERKYAEELGAVWSGDIGEKSPEKIDCIIDTTPVWKPVVEALQNLSPGGRLIINAIRKEDSDKDYLLQLDYTIHLWMEKEIKSVANVTRRDVEEFLKLASEIHIKPDIQEYSLEEANKALVELKVGKIRGAKVLRID